jgi:hypothetical protein
VVERGIVHATLNDHPVRVSFEDTLTVGLIAINLEVLEVLKHTGDRGQDDLPNLFSLNDAALRQGGRRKKGNGYGQQIGVKQTVVHT